MRDRICASLIATAVIVANTSMATGQTPAMRFEMKPPVRVSGATRPSVHDAQQSAATEWSSQVKGQYGEQWSEIPGSARYACQYSGGGYQCSVEANPIRQK